MMTRFIKFAAVLVLVAGCSQATEPSSSTVKSTMPVSFNPDGAPTIQFTVPDMMCPEGCGEQVKQILAEQSGAKDVLVDFESKIVTVAIDKEKFDSGQALAALKDHQFNNTLLKDAGAAADSAKPQAATAPAIQ